MRMAIVSVNGQIPGHTWAHVTETPRNCDGLLCHNDLFICLTEVGEDVSKEDLQQLLQEAWRAWRTADNRMYSISDITYYHIVRGSVKNWYWYCIFVFAFMAHLTCISEISFILSGGPRQHWSRGAELLQRNHVEGQHHIQFQG